VFPHESTASEAPPSSQWFATTHWSVVLAARQPNSPQAHDALATLCQTYWYALYAFIRRSGHDEATAKDLTQAFFERFLEKNFLKDVVRDKGRFRSFLLACVKHFLANERDREQAARRGGGFQIVPLDRQTIEANERQDGTRALSPETIYERRWALSLLEVVRRNLETEYLTAGRRTVYDALQAYLSSERGQAPYAEVASRLEMSVDAVKKAVERLRRRYGELLREEIAHTVTHPGEIDDEIRYLRTILSA